MMKKYVLGFLFSLDKSEVVLIEKLTPEWQRGMLNGIGGKIEKDEYPLHAMEREFYEEAGVKDISWLNAGYLKGDSWFMHVFYAFGDVNKCQTMEEEKVGVYKVGDINNIHVINNVKWIIPTLLSNKPIYFFERH